MKRTNNRLRNALLAAAGFLPATMMGNTVPAHPSDARFNTNAAGSAVASGPSNSASGTIFIGRDYYSNELSHMVVPFQLPDLGDGSFADVSVTFKVADGEAGETPAPINVNLFALPGSRPFSSPSPADVRGPLDHTQQGELVKGDLLNGSTEPGTVVSSGNDEAAALANWLNNAYQDGLNAGNFVFMRLSPAALQANTVGTFDEEEYGYGFEILSGNSFFGGGPFLSYTFTPAPVNKPVILNLTASPASLSVGGSAVLNWTATDADTLTLDPGGIDVTGLTSYTVNPTATTNYTLIAQGDGGTRTRNVTVAIQSGITVRGQPTSVTQAGNAPNGNVLVMAKPEGVGTGDLMIAAIAKNNAGSTDPQTTTPPAGWTAIDQKIIRPSGTHRAHASVFYKVATAADDSVTSYSFTLTTNANLGSNGQNGASGSLVAFSGVDSTAPFTQLPGTLTVNTTASTTSTAESITTTSALNPILFISMINAGNNNSRTQSNFATASSPGALTPIVQASKNGTNTSMAWGVQPSAGATGNGTATLSGNATTGGILLALRESPKPTIAFSSSPAVIKEGEPATLTWSVAKASSVTIDGIGSFGPSGTLTIAPSETTTYTIRAANADGESMSATKVTVLSPGPFRYYRMTPLAIREPGFNLLYMSSFHFTRNGVRVPAASVTSVVSGASALDNETATAFYSDNPGTGRPFRPIVYDMGADPANWNVNGNRIGSNTVNQPGMDMVGWNIEGSHDSTNWVGVSQQVSYRTPVKSGTLSNNIPFDFAPTVEFSANPSDVPSGGSSTLSWFVGGAQSVSIEGIGENLPSSGTREVTPADGNTTYTLTAVNGVYGTTVATTSVISGAASTPVVLTNASFESDVNTDPGGSFAAGMNADPFGWTVIKRGNSAFPAIQQVAVGSANLTPADGNQAMMLMAGCSIGQLIDLEWADLNAGDQLKLTVAAGDRATDPDGNPRWADDSFIGFTNGMAVVVAGGLGNVVGRSAAIRTPPGGYKSGFMGDVTYTYTLGGEEFQLEGKVGILIASLGYRDGTADGTDAPGAQSFWDNVRLELVRAPGPRIVSFTSSATSIIAGAETTLSWHVENAETVTISGLGTVAASGTAVVSPDDSGTFTLTASNVEGTKTRDIEFFVTGPVVYRYFRFSPLETRQPFVNGFAMGVNISEFEIYNGDTLLTGATASTPTSNVTVNQEPSKAVDGNFNTVWFDKFLEPLVLDFGTGVLATGYRFATGNSTFRDPISWKFEGSLDGVDWYLIDQRLNQPVPEERGVWVGSFTTNFNPDYPVVEGVPLVNIFAALPDSITETSSSTLSWEVSGADSVELIGFGDVAATGSQIVSPRSSINYYILARNASGFTFESARVRVNRLPRGTIVADAADANYETDITDGSVVSGPDWSSADLLDIGRFFGLDTVNHIVIPFKLPDLGSGGFLEAELTINVLGGDLGEAGRIPVQLFAIPGARVSPVTLAEDVVDGANNALTNGYLMKSGFLNSATMLDSIVGTGETGLTAEGLGYWLNEAYAAGANAGKYVFIRLSPSALDVPEGSGFAISSANDVEYAPQLSYVFNPEGATSLPVISNFATNTAILIEGGQALLQWTTFGAASVTIDGTSVDSSGSLVISPDTTTTYTLTAANDNGIRTVQTQQVVVPPGSYRYLRFYALKIRPMPNVNVMGDVRLALSEFEISDEDGPIPAINANVTDFNGFGGGAALVNGQLTDSWVARINGGFTIDYRSFVRPTAYRIGTAGGLANSAYDPVSWELEGSLDGNVWTEIDRRTDVGSSIPELNSSFSDYFYLFPVPEVESFASDVSIIPSGGSSTLSWNVANAASVFIDQGVGEVAPVGSMAVTPSETTTYIITASGNGVTRTAWTRVDVDDGTGMIAKVYDDLPYTSFYEFINPISRLDSEILAATFIQKDSINYTRETIYDRKPTDLPGLTSHHSYALVFTGWLDITVDGPGIYTFGTASVGGSTIFLDLNDDGDFDDPGELIVNNNLVDNISATGKVGNVNLTGNRVRIAIGFWDNFSLNDKLEVRFKKGSALSFADLDPLGGSRHFSNVEPEPPDGNQGASFIVSRFIKTGSVINLEWKSIPGENYAIETSTDLSEGSWESVGTGITSQGMTTTTMIDLAGTAYADSQRLFFRIRAGSESTN